MANKRRLLTLIKRAAKEGRGILDLSGNRLISLPPEISTLTNLTSLDLSNNRLTSLPEIATLTMLRSLDLSINQLTSLPPEISLLTDLTMLDLSVNQLSSLQSEIFTLTRLTTLSLSENQLTVLPPEISMLSNLIGLDLRKNQLTSLPPKITKLNNLTSLVLSENQLSSLPTEICTLENLTSLYLWSNKLTSLPPETTKLTNLTRLSLGNNQLTNLPPEITKLTSLTSLTLWSNGLATLPPEISELTNLTSLNLNTNQLTSLPPEISKLTNLTELDLSGNHLTSLPSEISKLTNLTELDLSGNQLTSVPTEIFKLTNLTSLDLSRNQLPIPPETLGNPQDVKAILAALAGLVTGERLNEAKMLVVGDGKVGKSSVVERLIHGTFDPKKQTTLGVEISDEMNVVQSEVKGHGEPVKVNIWDFGGQEIQHSTHLFFLTRRSLYLLVVDARKGDQISNIEYWLRLIESFGGESPIIVVINQIDQLKGQRALNLDRKALQGKYNITDFLETSCETGQGIPALKAAIEREIEQLKHVHDIWPREWLAIKRQLKAMQADYIPVEKYLEICAHENLNDADLRKSLLGLLHDLGIVIRFPGDTQVLNPRWVTQGVYGLLTSARLVQTQGQFDLEDVIGILSDLPDGKNRYPAYTHERLIRVMRHFELCFEFTDRSGHYLVPRHLHDNEPDIPWDDVEGLRFQYHYDILPDSIIPRFIVRMNQHIAEHYYWKNGVFLQNKGDENRARVKADLVDRKIFISIIGKEQTRRAFLAVIRSAFQEINSRFKIEIEQMIPVPGFPDVLVSYEELLVHEEMGVPDIVISKLRKKFSVRQLLDGVEDMTTRMERRERDQDGKFHERISEAIDPKRQARIFRIVVASPGDVQSERDVMPAVIDEVNRGVAADRGLHLVLSRWEIDTNPGFHSEGPQSLIDPILNITDCDLLIGIFWKRFGTRTADGKTGTEHEFGLAYKAWKEKGSPQIFVYFNLRAYTPKSTSDIEQSRQVIEFREKFPKEGLSWPYKGTAQFEKLVRNHLTTHIRSLPL